MQNTTVVRPYRISQSTFQNCYRGITSEWSTGATILFNEFIFGDVPETLFKDQIGIYLASDHSGFELQENNFVYSGSDGTTSIGILCQGLGSAPNVIRRNKFDGLYNAHQAFRMNAMNTEINSSGLIYLCDTIENTPIKGYDFLIPDVSPMDNIYRFQGEPIETSPGYLPAGNNFAHTGVDMHNEVGSSFLERFHYYWYDDGNQEPWTSLIGYTKEELLAENFCHQDFCAPPCFDLEDLGDIKGDYYNLISLKDLAIDDYWTAIIAEDSTEADSISILVSYYNREAFKTAYKVVTHIWLDTISFHVNTLITWYENLDTYGSDIMIAGELARSSSMSDALLKLNDISSNRDLTSTQEQDLDNVITIYSILDTTDILDLSSLEKIIIRSIAQSDIGVASAIGRSILSYHGETHPWPYYKGELNEPPIRYRFEEDAHQDDNLPSTIELRPIPASNFIIVEWLPMNKSIGADLNITDLYGRDILSRTIKSGDPVNIDVSDLIPGLYIALIRENSGKVNSKIFVVD